MYVVATPVSTFKRILGEKGVSKEYPLIPTVGIKANQGGSKLNAEARNIPSESSLGLLGAGWGYFT